MCKSGSEMMVLHKCTSSESNVISYKYLLHCLITTKTISLFLKRTEQNNKRGESTTTIFKLYTVEYEKSLTRIFKS